MRITKVKINKDEVNIEYTEDTSIGFKKFKMECDEEPAPEFVGALQSLQDDVLAILELPKEYGSEMNILGVGITYEDDDGMGIVISCTKKLQSNNSPVCFNTPYKRSEKDKDPQLSIRLSEKTIQKVEKIMKEANQYIDGKRAQRDIFDKE